MDTTDGGAARMEARGSATSTQDAENAVGPAAAVSADGAGTPDGAGGLIGAGTPDGAGGLIGAGSPASAEGAGGLPSAAGRAPATRASDRERDAVVQRIQQAFAEGRLDDAEFDERMRAALTARTRADLDVLLTDLPAAATPGEAPTVGRKPGRSAIALKGSVRRAGRWRVPEHHATVVYKGDGWLDLRAAELSGPVTSFFAVAYKSRVTILVPPSVRVEMTGLGVTQGAADEDNPGYRLAADAPVIHVRGLAYKGAVEITTRPHPRGALPPAFPPKPDS